MFNGLYLYVKLKLKLLARMTDNHTGNTNRADIIITDIAQHALRLAPLTMVSTPFDYLTQNPSTTNVIKIMTMAQIKC